MAESNPTVEYRELPGCPGYRIGNDGTLWTCRPRNGKGPLRAMWCQIRPTRDKAGYVVFSLAQGRTGHRRQYRVHRLVLQAFVGECPQGHQACHNDGSRANNILGNLRWDTPSANNKDKVRHGTAQRGENSGMSKLTSQNVIDIRKRLAAKDTQASIAKDFGVSPKTIRSIAQRRAWWYLDAD